MAILALLAMAGSARAFMLIGGHGAVSCTVARQFTAVPVQFTATPVQWGC